MTATATDKTQNDIVESLGMVCPVVLKGSFNRPNISYSLRFKVLMKDPFQDLLGFLKERRGECGIVYTFTRAQSEMLAERLEKEGGESIEAYHAGLPAKRRAKTLNNWMGGETKIVAATIAFGMGIDKRDVRFVVHWHFAGSFEGFYQESGRCGRDGGPSVHVMYYSEGEYKKMMRCAMRGSKRGSVRRRVAVGSVERLKEYCLAKGCRRKVILDYFEETGGGVGGGGRGLVGGGKVGGKKHHCCDVCDGKITPSLPAEKKEKKGGGRGKKGKKWGARAVGGEGAPKAPKAPKKPRKRLKER